LIDLKTKATQLDEEEACKALMKLEAEGIAFGIACGLGLA
jgi:hypothetical protein